MIDASIYNSANRPTAQLNDPMDQMGKVMTMKQLSAKNQAYDAELKAAEQKRIISEAFPVMQQLADLTPEERAKQSPIAIAELSKRGVPLDNWPKDQMGNPIHDESVFQRSYTTLANSPVGLEIMKSQAEIAKLRADAKRKENPEMSFATQLALLGYRDRQEEKREKKVIDLQERLSGSQALAQRIQGLENTLGFSLEDYKNNKKDLPGFSVPGIGRVTAFNGDARVLESQIAKLFNTELKDRSGSAVTSPELERLKIEFGAGKYNTEEEMLGALAAYKQESLNVMQNIERAAPKDAMQELRARGVTLSDSLTKKQETPKYPPPPPGKIRVRSPDGVIGLIDEADKGEAIAAGGSVVK